jgi:RNA polymerase sigma-70 factor, ECF subfamily
VNDRRVNIFERERRHLLCVAFRILGTQADAEDVVQETWIKYDRSDTSSVRNLPAWLTTVASRLCVDVLRRRQEIPQEAPEVSEVVEDSYNPEETALLAGELTTAFTVVLEALTPPQRVALVLHDAFGVPFEEVAHILGTTLASAKKLASRARQQVRRRTASAPKDNPIAREIAEVFLRAVREGNTRDLVAVLDPNVIRTADPQVLPPGAAQRIQGLHAIVEEAVQFRTIASRARIAEIDWQPGIVIRSGPDLQLAIIVCIVEERIVQFDVIADPQRLARLTITDPERPS